MKLGLLIGILLTASPVLILAFVDLAVTFGAPRETGNLMWLSLTALTVLTPIGIVVLVMVGLSSIFTKAKAQQRSDRNSVQARPPESAIGSAWRLSNGALNIARVMGVIDKTIARHFVAYSSVEPEFLAPMASYRCHLAYLRRVSGLFVVAWTATLNRL